MAVNEVAIDVSAEPYKPDTAWRSDSVCRTHPTRWWFAGDYRESTRAKEICADCVVRSPCLEYALSRPDLLGIWAATTPNERAAMRRDLRAGRTPAAANAAGRPAPAPAPGTVEAIGLDATLEADIDADIDVDLDLVHEAAVDAGTAAETEAVPVFASRFAAVLDRVPARAIRGRRPDRDAGRVFTPAAPRAATGGRDGDDLMTPAEAGARLGVTPNTVTRWSRAGKLSAIQTMGGHRRFRRSEIERVLREANRGPIALDTPDAVEPASDSGASPQVREL